MKAIGILGVVLALISAVPVWAAPERYLLQAEASRVAFSAPADGQPITGTFPIRSARVVIDVEKPARSQIDVTLKVAGVKASSLLAAEAMRGESVLATRRFPDARFVSDSVRGDPSAVEVGGQLTLRGVTRPVVLRGRILRQSGAAEDDFSRLTVALRGQVSRSAFGADGWAGMVGDVITLDILARIQRAGG